MSFVGDLCECICSVIRRQTAVVNSILESVKTSSFNVNFLYI